MNKKEKHKKERERDPFGEEAFFSIEIDSEGRLCVYRPVQKRGEEPLEEEERKEAEEEEMGADGLIKCLDVLIPSLKNYEKLKKRK